MATREDETGFRQPSCSGDRTHCPDACSAIDRLYPRVMPVLPKPRAQRAGKVAGNHRIRRDGRSLGTTDAARAVWKNERQIETAIVQDRESATALQN